MTDPTSAAAPRWHIGGDIGGTFTDLIAWSPGRPPALIKIPSTLENQANGLLAAIRGAVGESERKDIAEVLHGTTVATNAILERRGVKTAIVTTAGFRDLLELGRRTRPQVYGLRGSFEPHVPRWLRFEVPGRLNREGLEIEPLDRAAVREVAVALRAQHVESVAVVLLHSYLDRSHEDQVGEWLSDELPGVPITLSADVLPEIREFERTVATTLNAYVEPILSRYLDDLAMRLHEMAPDARVRVMQGNGGTVPIERLQGFPIRSVISGPAAGVTGATRILDELDITEAIACDMGGTSFDVGVIDEGRPLTTTEMDLEYNVPIRIPTLDIKTIGAGGGSIAHLDPGGMLRVGPASAGATPGPIWYGKGGTEFTVTDANVLSGRLVATTLGTDLRPPLGPNDIWETVQKHHPDLVAAFPTPTALSEAVLKVVVATMAACVRDVTVATGRDPRQYALIAYGGAGPLHACEIARGLGIRRVVVPAFPGLLSAYGCLIAEHALDAIVSVRGELGTLDVDDLRCRLEAQATHLEETLSGIEDMPVRIRALYECQFDRQTHSLFVEGPIGADDNGIREAFLERYRLQYGALIPTSAIVLRSVRLEGRAARRAVDSWVLGDVAADAVEPPPGARFWRPALSAGTRIEGPATVSAPDATTYIPDGAVAVVGDDGHMIVEVDDES